MTLFDLPPPERPAKPRKTPVDRPARARTTAAPMEVTWPCTSCGDPIDKAGALCWTCRQEMYAQREAAEQAAWRAEAAHMLEVGADAWWAATNEAGMLCDLWPVDPEDTMEVIRWRCEQAASPDGASYHRVGQPEHAQARNAMYHDRWRPKMTEQAVVPEVWGWPPDDPTDRRAPDRWQYGGRPPELPITRWGEDHSGLADVNELLEDHLDERLELVPLLWPYPARRIECVAVAGGLL